MDQEPINKQEQEEQLEKEQDEEQDLNETLVNLFTQIISNEFEGFIKLKDYIASNKPSLNNIFKALKTVVESSSQNEQKFYSNIPKILGIGLQQKFQRLLQRSLLNYLEENQSKLLIDQYKKENIGQLWKQIYYNEIPQFIKIFHLENEITIDNFENMVNELRQKKKFDDAYRFIQAVKMDRKYLYDLINKMSNNQDVAKAADFIINSKLPFTDFPEAIERLQKKCSRFYLNSYKNSWFKCEEILQQDLQILAYYVEDLYYKGQKQEALSIIKRNNLAPMIKKYEVLQNYDENINPIENILFANDDFVACMDQEEKKNFICLSDFKISEQQVHFIDAENEDFEKCSQILLSQKLIGFDLEFQSAMTKLSETGIKLYILQLATDNEVFLFDLVSFLGNQNFRQLLSNIFSNNNIHKVGLSLKQDLKFINNDFNLENTFFRSILDIGTVFASIYYNETKSSLEHIVHFLFKKPLSKFEQISNWGKRPLRRAQIHYAALDAFITIKIYQKLIEAHDEETILGEMESFKF